MPKHDPETVRAPGTSERRNPMVDNPTSTDRDRNLPRIWKLPPEPPPDVTQVWDAEGQVWCRLENEDPSMWVPWDTPTDEGHVTEEAITWRDLLIDYGPICDRPPEEANPYGPGDFVTAEAIGEDGTAYLRGDFDAAPGSWEPAGEMPDAR